MQIIDYCSGIKCLLFFIFLPSVYAQIPFQDSTNQLYGYKNKDKSIFIKPQYEVALPFSLPLQKAIVKINSFYTFINFKGNPSKKNRFDSLGFDQTIVKSGFFKGITRFQKNKNWGIISYKGKIIMAPEYQDIFIDTLNALLLGKKNGQDYWQLYSLNGQAILSKPSLRIKSLFKHFYAIQTDVKTWQLFNCNYSKPIVQNLTMAPILYDYLPSKQLSDLRFLIRRDYFYELIDFEGKKINDKRYKLKDSSLIAYPKYTFYSKLKTYINEVYADSLWELAKHVFALKLNDSLAIFNTQTADIFAIGKYDSLKILSNDYIGVKKAGLWGLIDSDGMEILDPKYLKIDSLGFALLWLQEKKTNTLKNRVFDLKKRRFILSNYDIIWTNTSLFLVKVKGKYGYIDRLKNWIIPSKYNYLSPIQYDWIVAKKENYWGILNQKNEKIISFFYDSLLIINDNYMLYFEDNEWGTYNKNGFEYYRSKAKFEILDNGFLKLKHKGKQGLVDAEGFLGIPILYDSLANALKGGLLEINHKRKTTYMDMDSKVLPPPYYEGVYFKNSPSEKYIPAQAKDGFWGLIDYLGRWRISNRYDSVKQISEGYVPFKFRAGWGYLNKNEKISIQPLYQYVGAVKKGMAIVKKGGLYGLLALKNNDFILPLKYDYIEITPSNNYYFYQNGKVGWYSPSLKKRIYPKYNAIQDIGMDFLFIEEKSKESNKSHKIGVDMDSGVSLFLAKYDGILYFTRSGYFGLMNK